MSAWRVLWEAINEELEGESRTDFLAALDEGGDSISEFERQLDELDEHEVDPYAELAHMRTCITRFLPSDALGRIFSIHADLVFADRGDRYLRE